MTAGDRTTIDLGTYRYQREGATGEVTAPAPGRRLRHSAARRWGLAVSAVLLLPLAGAAAPPDPELHLVARVPLPDGENAPWEVDDGQLYLATAESDAGDREWTLTAYHLADGRVRWRAPLEGSNPPGMWPAGPTLVVTTSGRDGSYATTGYDPASGQPRWTRPQDTFRVVSDELVLLRTPVPPSGATWELMPVDPHTGRDVGGPVRVTGDHLDVRTRSGGGVEVVALSRDGTMTRYDLATGDVAAVRTPHRAGVDGAIQNWLRVDGGLVLAGARGGEDPPSASAYDAETLAHRWDAPTATVLARPCGPVVCASGQPGGVATVHGLDPATGQVRWTASCETVAAPAGTSCRDVAAVPMPSARLWVGWRFVEVRLVGEPRESNTGRVVDAATGRPVAAVGRWAPAAPQQGPGLLLTRREPVVRPGTGDGAEPSPDRTWWALTGDDLTDLDVLGTTGRGSSCRPHLPYLVCAGEEEMTLWRVGA